MMGAPFHLGTPKPVQIWQAVLFLDLPMVEPPTKGLPAADQGPH